MHRTAFIAQYYLAPNVTSTEVKELWSTEWGSGVWLPIFEFSFSHCLVVQPWATYYACLNPSGSMNIISTRFAVDVRFKWANACETLTQCQGANYLQNTSPSILGHLWLLVSILEIICLTLFLTISVLILHDLMAGVGKRLQGGVVLEHARVLDSKWKFKGESSRRLLNSFPHLARCPRTLPLAWPSCWGGVFK